MSQFRIVILGFCLIGFSLGLSAQKGAAKQADKYFKAEKYADALSLYNQVENIQRDPLKLYKRGISNYYTNNVDDAVKDFTIASSIGLRENKVYLYTGMALMAKSDYRKAAPFFKNYLRYANSKEEQARVIGLIKQCLYGINHTYDDQLGFVENLGQGVNTEYDEFKPVQSPSSQNKYYFSSNRPGSNGGMRNKKGFKDEIYGKYFADMYAAEIKDGNWTPVGAFHPILNSPKHDVLQGFNSDGSVLYFMKTLDKQTGVMMADTFVVDRAIDAFPSELESPVISNLGDKDLQIFNNETMLFASKRVGGYGGYDIYATHKKEGQWMTPVNLGPEINSEYDDVSPFLLKSGTKLYFSSNRLESMGGFDIFEAEYSIESNSWKSPKNVGLPINSPRNENYYSVSGDGMTATFNSDRIDSYGGNDIYLAYFKNQVTEQLMYTEELAFLIPIPEDTTATVVVEEIIEEVPDPTPVIEVDKKDFFNEPLFYGSDEIIVSPANVTKMDRIVDFMKIYPELKLILVGNSTQEGLKEFDIYFSIKRAEKAADYITKKGISASRISVKGLGSNFPHTNEDSRKVSILAQKNNRRIDAYFLDVPEDKLSVNNEQPSVADFMRNPAYTKYVSTVEGLSYKILVAQSKQMYKSDIVNVRDDVTVEKDFSENEYTYSVGIYDSYTEARIVKNELVRNGVPNAKIIPYIDGMKLDSGAIESQSEIYPNLKDYLLYE